MSEGTGTSRDRRVTDRIDDLSRYDLLLLAIPAAFLAGLLLSALTGIPPRLGLVGAGAVGGLALADGLFLNPPRRPGARQGRS